MRTFMTSTALAALLLACAPKPQTDINTPTPDQVVRPSTEGATKALSELQMRYHKIAEIDLTGTDTRFLNDEQRQVVNLLIEAAGYMDEIYLRQVEPRNPQIRAAIAASNRPEKDLLINMFDRHFGPWDSLDDDHPFWGDKPKPLGAGFYPADMTKQEFEAWIAANPEDEAAFRSWYTIVSRKDGGLVAEPYSKVYAQWLIPAAAKLNEAANLTSNSSLRKFLSLRAKAFLDDDYLASEMAWMDLKDTPIEVVIGPYEVYTDKLYNVKTAFEAFITVKNPEESAALSKYKKWLVDMEKNLPVEEGYKNFKCGVESPIVASYQIRGGGDNVPGVQTIAFNLPNDERVREAKGAKKVILTNVLGAKFDLILAPMAEQILVKEQSGLLIKKYMSYGTLFHELSHSLGPGTIEVDGKKTTVSAALQELSTTLEEGKADVMGAYNIAYMMQRGELPKSEKQAFLATYFTGLFRSMRFGTDSAHGGGASYQYSYFKQAGAFSWDAAENRYRLDFVKLEQAISDLTGEIVVLQGNGHYADAKIFLDTYKKLDDNAKQVLASTGHIPTDIAPIYPDKI